MYESQVLEHEVCEIVVITEDRYNRLSFEIAEAKSLEELQRVAFDAIETGYLEVEWLDEHWGCNTQHICRNLDKLCREYNDREERLGREEQFNELCF